MKATQGQRLTSPQRATLIKTLEARFNAHPDRHPHLKWAAVKARLDSNASKLWSLNEMERSGGEPDVVNFDSPAGAIIFVDCSEQSPGGRRNLCFDEAALQSRKEHKPKGSALAMAAAIGATMLSEAEYRRLQQLGAYDTTTSSWVQTPAEIRMLGGALFCDRRFNTVFLYHNGAESYYSARGFRSALRI